MMGTTNRKPVRSTRSPIRRQWNGSISYRIHPAVQEQHRRCGSRPDLVDGPAAPVTTTGIQPFRRFERSGVFDLPLDSRKGSFDGAEVALGAPQPDDCGSQVAGEGGRDLAVDPLHDVERDGEPDR